MAVDGLDQSWGRVNASKAASAGIKVISMYLSYDSSKNVRASDVRAYHKVNIATLINWEHSAGAPLEGGATGRADATEAVKQLKKLIRDVGYAPKNKLVIYFSCDRDINSRQYPAIDAYYRAARTVVHNAGFLIGAYGEADLIHHLAAEKITDAEWQTLAWSGGRIDPAADFYQSSINNTLAGSSVDFNKIIHARELGAWWSPTNALNVSEDDDVSAQDVVTALNSAQGQAAIRKAVWDMKASVSKEGNLPPTKTDTNTTMAGFLVGGWRFARGGYYKAATAANTAAIAKAVAAAVPKNISELTSAQVSSIVEAAVKDALNHAKIQVA